MSSKSKKVAQLQQPTQEEMVEHAMNRYIEENGIDEMVKKQIEGKRKQVALIPAAQGNINGWWESYRELAELWNKDDEGVLVATYVTTYNDFKLKVTEQILEVFDTLTEEALHVEQSKFVNPFIEEVWKMYEGKREDFLDAKEELAAWRALEDVVIWYAQLYELVQKHDQIEADEKASKQSEQEEKNETV